MTKKLKYLDSDVLQAAEDDIMFEHTFFSHIAESDEYDIIPLSSSGLNMSDEEKITIALTAQAEGRKLLFMISLGNYAIVFGENTQLIGISPESDIHGFPC